MVHVVVPSLLVVSFHLQATHPLGRAVVVVNGSAYRESSTHADGVFAMPLPRGTWDVTSKVTHGDTLTAWDVTLAPYEDFFWGSDLLRDERSSSHLHVPLPHTSTVRVWARCPHPSSHVVITSHDHHTGTRVVRLPWTTGVWDVALTREMGLVDVDLFGCATTPSTGNGYADTRFLAAARMLTPDTTDNIAAPSPWWTPLAAAWRAMTH